jgi:hypothetical protein
VKIGSGSIKLDMLDARVMKKSDLYIIARADGKVPTKNEMIQYKKNLRSQMLKAKRSEKYLFFSENPGM